MHLNTKRNLDVLVVGAGFAGSVVARELAESGREVLVIDRRSHIAGNAYDSYDSAGVLIHNYGPHIFHANSDKIVRWLSRFTDWRFYEHRVLAKVGEKLVPLPINRTTINMLYGLELDEAGVSRFLDTHRERRDCIQNSEDLVLNSVGRDLCEKFFKGYTRKQWGMELKELSAGVAARIPTRTNDDDRYFTDTYQLTPLRGYTVMFDAILNHPKIRVELGVEHSCARHLYDAKTTIYTGPIDEYYDYRFGKLPYRSLRFEHAHIMDRDHFQAVGTVNFPNDYDFTRITEFKHITGQNAAGTSIVYEYPQADGEPFYPILRAGSDNLYKKYQDLAEKERGVHFVGRLAQYRYYNMDQVVGSALHAAHEIIS